jgi:hypothetical protein
LVSAPPVSAVLAFSDIVRSPPSSYGKSPQRDMPAAVCKKE